jgi:hypothetical protein
VPGGLVGFWLEPAEVGVGVQAARVGLEQGMRLAPSGVGVAGVGVVDGVEDRVKPGVVIGAGEDLLELIGDARARGHDRRVPVGEPPGRVVPVLGARVPDRWVAQPQRRPATQRRHRATVAGIAPALV